MKIFAGVIFLVYISSIEIRYKQQFKFKIMTTEQKQAMQIKRELNPQFAHVQSKARKISNEQKRTDVKQMLLMSKATFKDVDQIAETHKELIMLDKATNEIHLSECRKAINFIVKKGNESLIELFGKASKKNKNGLFSVYCTEQLISKIVKIKLDKSFDYETCLNMVIASNKKKEAKKQILVEA